MGYSVVILYYLLVIYFYIMIVGCFLTWMPFLYRFRIFRLIRKISSFYLSTFEGVIVIGPFDITPVIGFAVYSFILQGFTYLYL